MDETDAPPTNGNILKHTPTNNNYPRYAEVPVTTSEHYDEDFDEEMKLAMALSLSLTKQNSNTCSTISDSNLTHEEGETKKNTQNTKFHSF